MKFRCFRMAAVACCVVFFSSSFAAVNTWTLLTTSGYSPYTFFPGNTSATAVNKVSIGVTTAAPSELYVKSQAANLPALIVSSYSTPTADIAQFQVNGASSVVISKQGYVGIGVASPVYPLSIATTTSDQNQAIFGQGKTTGDEQICIGEKDDGTRKSLNVGFSHSVSAGYLQLSGQSIGSGIVLANNGNVGVGSTAPTEKLEVSGNIKCNSVKIGTWSLEAPDYVFEKGYKLPTIKEVENHIASEKHLPGVPSAAEMKTKGVDLSEMNMILLKKVEELTLYVIEQNKKIEALQGTVEKR
jgi:hypothetical protein